MFEAEKQFANEDFFRFCFAFTKCWLINKSTTFRKYSSWLKMLKFRINETNTLKTSAREKNILEEKEMENLRKCFLGIVDALK